MLGDGQKRVIYRGKMLFSQGTPHPAFMLKADAEVAAKGGGQGWRQRDELRRHAGGRHRRAGPFSFTATRDPAFRFKSGQFTMIGLPADDRPLLRAYSLACAAHEDQLEFFSIKGRMARSPRVCRC